MLEVHPPRETVHTWKDFFVHIATISVGLLIAIGLEQTVEYFHHLHQLEKARSELTSELKANLKVLNQNLAVAEGLKAQLDHNMALLHAAQTSRAPIGRQLTSYGETSFFWPVDGPWQVDRQNGSLALMPHLELSKYTYLHEVIATIMDGLLVLSTQMSHANAIAKRAPAGDFTPKDLEELVTATSVVQGRLSNLTSFLQLEKIGLESDDWR